MPYFRVNGMLVHMRLGGPFHKQPKPCVARITLDGKACQCLAISAFACDHPVGDSNTCDAPLCAEHATEIGPDRHLCPMHLEQHRAREAEAR